MLKKIGLKTILYSGFGIALALVLLVGIYSFQQIRFVRQNYTHVMNQQTDPFLAVSAIKVLAESEVATVHNVVERYKKTLDLESAIEDFHSKIKAPTSHQKTGTPQQIETVPEQEKKREAAGLKKTKQIANSWKNVKKNITKEKNALLAECEAAFSKTTNDISSYRQPLEDLIKPETPAKDDPLVLFDQSREAFMDSWKELKGALLNGTYTKKAEKVMKEKGALVLKASTLLTEKLNERNLATINRAHSAVTKASIRILVILFFAILISVATAYLIITAAAKKVVIASTGLEEVSKIVQITAQQQVQAFQKALAGIENIKTAFGEIQTNTNQAVSTAKQLLEVSKRLTNV